MHKNTLNTTLQRSNKFLKSPFIIAYSIIVFSRNLDNRQTNQHVIETVPRRCEVIKCNQNRYFAQWPVLCRIYVHACRADLSSSIWHAARPSVLWR